jgi:hypothetical protein
MFRKLLQELEWDKWVLKFNPLKYLGIIFMICGLLFAIYLHLFKTIQTYVVIIISIISFFVGFILWINGWDPYETVIQYAAANVFLSKLKDIFELVEWYKWLLNFNILKCLSIAIMIIPPLYFIYRVIFLDSDILGVVIYSAISIIIGIVIWLISWDPYK